MPAKAPTPTRFTSLLLFLVLMGINPPARAEFLLSSDNFNSWSSSCWRCDIDLHYDVIQGDVIRLNADRIFGATLENRIRRSSEYPELSWYWSLDPFIEPAIYFSMEVYFRASVDRRKYMIRYTWNSEDPAGTVYALNERDNEWEWVVTGKEAEPLRWYEVKRHLSQDFASLTGLHSSIDIYRIKVGLGSAEKRKLSASGYLSSVRIDPRPEPIWLDVVLPNE